MDRFRKLFKKLIVLLLIIMIFNGLQAQVMNDSAKVREDTILFRKYDSITMMMYDSLKGQLIDSIKNLFPDSSLIRNITDSLNFLYFQDSLQTAYIIDSISFMYDSIKTTLYFDSIDNARNDSIRRNFNHSARMSLEHPITHIDDDSVRYSLNDLSNYIFSDSVNSVVPDSLKGIIKRLVGHLANDSTNIFLVNSMRDTTLLKLNKYKTDSVFVWLQNILGDSAKVFIQSVDKHTVKMWVDEDIFLDQMWKRQLDSDLIGNPTDIYINHLPKKIKSIPIPKRPWQWWGNANLHLAQGLKSNWAKGGESSISAETLIKEYCNYTLKNSKWENSFLFQYGLLKSGDYDSFRKNKDRLEINSKFGQKAFKHWYYTAYANMKTQSFKGYRYPNDSVPVSKFLAPVYIQFGIGMDYKPSKKFAVLMAPLGAKFTVVADTVLINQVQYGLAEDKKIRKEMGATINSKYKSTIAKNVVLENKIGLFSNYLEKPQNIDIDWEVIINMKVNRYMNVTLSTHLIYDDNILLPLYEKIDGVKTNVGTGKRIQFQESLTVGLSYQF